MTIVLEPDMARAVLGAVRGAQMASAVFGERYSREADGASDPALADMAFALASENEQRAIVLAEAVAIVEAAMTEQAPRAVAPDAA